MGTNRLALSPVAERARQAAQHLLDAHQAGADGRPLDELLATQAAIDAYDDVAARGYAIYGPGQAAP